MKERQLKRVVTDFVGGMLAGRPPDSMCYIISVPLAGYLSHLGVECFPVEGLVDGWHHWWIRLADGRIIDATAGQFNTPAGEPMPAIYIGEAPAWYEEEA